MKTPAPRQASPISATQPMPIIPQPPNPTHAYVGAFHEALLVLQALNRSLPPKSSTTVGKQLAKLECASRELDEVFFQFITIRNQLNATAQQHYQLLESIVHHIECSGLDIGADPQPNQDVARHIRGLRVILQILAANDPTGTGQAVGGGTNVGPGY